MIKQAKDVKIPVLLIRSYEHRETPSHLEESANGVVINDSEEILKEIKNTVDDRNYGPERNTPFKWVVYSYTFQIEATDPPSTL